MNCVIQGKNVKVFAKAIHSLSKIGSALFFEPNENSLCLRTINCNKSAFATFTFNEFFFAEYNVNTIGNSEELSNYIAKCRISIKACIGIFKNMKEVEFCKIVMDMEKLVVEMHCHLNTKKKYIISIIDEDTLQSAHIFDKDVNCVSAFHKIWGDISNNFQMAEEEITLDFDIDNVIVKNYVEGSSVDPKFMRSQLTLQSAEFNTYSVKNKVSITFCLREFRAILYFIDSFNLELQLEFSSAGQPALFTNRSVNEFEINMLLSTLSPDDVTMYQSFTDQSMMSKNQKQDQITSRIYNKPNDTITPNDNNKTAPESEKNVFGSLGANNSTLSLSHPTSSLMNDNRKMRTRTVFSRCFNSDRDNLNNYNSTILAKNSDTEE